MRGKRSRRRMGEGGGGEAGWLGQLVLVLIHQIN